MKERVGTCHDFKMDALQLLFRREAKSGPVVGGDLLMILDYLLRVTAIEDELHNRTLFERA